MTAKTKGQIVIEYDTDIQKSKDKIFENFKQAEFLDCKINAFPFQTEYTIDIDVKNKTAASFIMIDLDLRDFEGNKVNLDKQVEKTMKKMFTIFHGQATPTLMWTGNGFHIYQPLNGLVFEEFVEFYTFLPYLDGKDLTTEFLRFAEKYFTKGKSDPNHNPSIKSCLVRIPGTINSKNGTLVEIIQKWNGIKPPIQYVTMDFKSYLIQRRIDKIREKENRNKRRLVYTNSFKNTDKVHEIRWIENLLKTPIEDYRKTTVGLIIVPYFIVVKNLDEQTTFDKVKEWLDSCSKIRKLDSNINYLVRQDIKTSLKKRIPPIKIQTLKESRPGIYRLFKNKNILNNTK